MLCPEAGDIRERIVGTGFAPELFASGAHEAVALRALTSSPRKTSRAVAFRIDCNLFIRRPEIPASTELQVYLADHEGANKGQQGMLRGGTPYAADLSEC